MERTDCLVIGAGVVGLAIARELAMAGHSAIIVERHARIGSECSSRNSGVIHAGLHYPPGSLKAGLCVAGRNALYDYCEIRSVPVQRCGKLIVATSPEQEVDLERIAGNAWANGVTDLVRLDGAGARALEPALRCSAALLSPSTGIVDTGALLLALLADAEHHGAVLACNTTCTRLRSTATGVLWESDDSREPLLHTRWLINASGLNAVATAASILGFPTDRLPRSFLAKGNYFSLPGRSPFSRLVYPVPEPGGLGVHLTLDLGGQARFGPDVQWVDSVDYTVERARTAYFEEKIRAYWPGLPTDALAPAYAGIRPKISGPGEPAADFRIDGPEQHGVPGVVNLFGIESPGLTSSLAIAKQVAAILARS